MLLLKEHFMHIAADMHYSRHGHCKPLTLQNKNEGEMILQ